MAKGTGFTLRPDDPRTFGAWVRHRARTRRRQGRARHLRRPPHVPRARRRTDRTAAGFASLGLARGEHVSLMMQNSIENVEAWFGLQKAGLVEVPVHTASRGNALQYIVDHADARMIVIDEAFLPYLAGVVDGLAEAPARRRQPQGAGRSAAVELPSRLAVHDLADLYVAGPPPDVQQQRTDTAVVLHSSGTTGPAEGRRPLARRGHPPHPPPRLADGLHGRRHALHRVPALPQQREVHERLRRARGRRHADHGEAVPGLHLLGADARAEHHRVQLHGRAADDAPQAGPAARRRRQPGPDRVRRAVPGRDLGGLRGAVRDEARRGLRHDRGADDHREPARQSQDRLGRPHLDDVRGADRRRERRAVPARTSPARSAPGRRWRVRCSAATTSGPTTPSRRGATSGSTPAIAAGWTRTASSSSSTGSRTASAGAARTSPRGRSSRRSTPTTPCSSRAAYGVSLRAVRGGRDGRRRPQARRAARARGAARLLHRQDGPLRHPALRPLHGRAPAQPRRARAEDRAARRRDHHRHLGSRERRLQDQEVDRDEHHRQSRAGRPRADAGRGRARDRRLPARGRRPVPDAAHPHPRQPLVRLHRRASSCSTRSSR